MTKRMFFLAFLFTLNFSYAQMVNGIAAIVENEPITLYEVYALKEQLKSDESQALNLLIRDRLEQAQIKNLGINVTPFEVNERIDAIAKQNNMTNIQFRSSVESQGINFTDFKNDIEKKMLQEKLYRNIASEAGKNITDERAKAYYEANREQFNVFSSAQIVLFRAGSMEELENQRGKLSPVKGVQAQNLNIEYSNTNPQLAFIIANAAIGDFTQIFRTQEDFNMFYVKDKVGSYTPSFEQIKDEIINNLYQNEQERTMQDYFDKLRAKAKVQIIR
ncbi:MAG: SurA N-terminal domain-containing protein [Campylobacter sp.]|nr:SurA N-terminal domain-containing protein [Campylobacter sp.]